MCSTQGMRSNLPLESWLIAGNPEADLDDILGHDHLSDT